MKQAPSQIFGGIAEFRYGDKMKKLKTRIVMTLVLLVLGTSGHAAKYSLTGAVDDILVNKGTLGRCAIAVEGFSAPGNCGSKWVSLDCSGDFNDKSVSRTMLELAQIAKATGSNLSVYFNDDNLHNGRCVAYQLILR